MEEEIKRFVSYLETERGMTANTMDAYSRDIRQFAGFLTDHGLNNFADAGETTVMTYLLSLQNQGKSPATVARQLSSIRGLYQYLMNFGNVQRDPTLKIESPKGQKKVPVVPTVKEIEALICQPNNSSDIGIRDRAMLELLYATGIRVTELTSLNVEDVRLDLGYIRCRNRTGSRVVPLGAMALQALGEYMKNGRKAGAEDQERALFLNYNGGRLTRQGFWKILKQHTKEANLTKPITPQTLRHSFATHLVENGADLKVVQEMMGHSGIASTQFYIQVSEQNKKDAYMKAHPRAGEQ